MIQFLYKSETAEKLIQYPEDRSIAVRNLIHELGRKLIGFDYFFGDYDRVVLIDIPYNKSLLAASMVSFAGGATSKIKTASLIPVEDAIAAMKKGGGLKSAPPKSK